MPVRHFILIHFGDIIASENGRAGAVENVIGIERIDLQRAHPVADGNIGAAPVHVGSQRNIALGELLERFPGFPAVGRAEDVVAGHPMVEGGDP